ncbi:uncharacterized protein L203_102601 [Cryptococcus depauperatus CBS 7841]|uniref:Uncharacterized protein n=1 Tax=Cryptococcus depauperatus CBS 7841 TaxID=1295531 RepID=A0A1E3IDT5_9TREE|nr:hypothetical protein L203_03967 [Cryptococcus depauperatus CBS 7841]
MGFPSEHDLYMAGGQSGTWPKQPNFLQKLYAFLSLNPHPCPDVIYWASDSKQLVIAQPDKLVQQVLPKLFKHDKLASFGRQLNIYGFSRLFPGRQFKDANGNISNASIWAHPTLHRLSTSEELNNVKRRAPPKLIRTRRLANGEIVRTRAGPAVLEKAKEVKEVMKEGRRKRVQAWAGGGVTQLQEQGEKRQESDIQDSVPSAPFLGHAKLTTASYGDVLHTHLTNIPEITEHEARLMGCEQRQIEQLSLSFQAKDTSSTPNTLSRRTSQGLLYSSPPAVSRIDDSATTSIQDGSSLLPQTPQEWSAFLTPANSHPNKSGLHVNTNLANRRHHQRIASPIASVTFTNNEVSGTPPIYNQSCSSSVMPTPLASPRPFGSIDSNSSFATISTPTSIPSSIQASNLSLHSAVFADNSQGYSASPLKRQIQPLHSPNAASSKVQGPQTPTGTIDPRWISPAGSLWSTPSATRAPSPALISPVQKHIFPPAEFIHRLTPEFGDGEDGLFETPMFDLKTKLVPPPFNFASAIQPMKIMQGDQDERKVITKLKSNLQTTQPINHGYTLLPNTLNEHRHEAIPSIASKTFPPSSKELPLFTQLFDININGIDTSKGTIDFNENTQPHRDGTHNEHQDAMACSTLNAAGVSRFQAKSFLGYN